MCGSPFHPGYSTFQKMEQDSFGLKNRWRKWALGGDKRPTPSTLSSHRNYRSSYKWHKFRMGVPQPFGCRSDLGFRCETTKAKPQTGSGLVRG